MIKNKIGPIPKGEAGGKIPIPGLITPGLILDSSFSNDQIHCSLKHQKILLDANLNPLAVNPAINYVYTPQQLRKAYGVDLITPLNNQGAGITIAVIIAYSYPNLQRDFNTYCTRFSLPPLTLDIRRMASRISFNSGWALEECLDVQMVHTMAPYARIMVVEATSNSFLALNNAVTYAVNNGANIVTM